jgi:lysophospholipase L1-like esterase
MPVRGWLTVLGAALAAATLLPGPQSASWTTRPTAARLAPGSAVPCGGVAWTGGWTASPSSYLGYRAPSDAHTADLIETTIREIATVHSTGSAIRIRLSNALGYRPAVIGAVTIAPSNGSAAVDAKLNRRVTFSAARPAPGGFVMAPGDALVSDPVAMSVTAFDKLAISIWVRSSQTPTTHELALQTSYVALSGTGNLTTQPNANLFARTSSIVLLADSVDVLSSQYGGTLVTVGDSITDGDGTPSMLNRDIRYPDDLQRLMLSSGRTLAVLNAGISANQVTRDGPRGSGGPSLLHRFDRDVLSHPNLIGILLLEGINDLGISKVPPGDIIAGYVTLAQRAHAAHVPILIGTLTPLSGAVYNLGTVQRDRQTINDWIRSQGVFDGVVDFDTALQDPAHPGHYLPKYNSGDNLHPSPAGYQAMATAAANSLPSLHICS